MKRKIIIQGALSVVAGIALFLIINTIRKKQLEKQLEEILEKASKATGTPKDLKSDDGFNPSFYKSYKNAKIITSDEADKYAKTIYDSIGNIYDDEPKIVSTIKKIGTKTKLSFVSDRFLTKYGKSLGSFITEKVDKDNNLKTIQDVIKLMPVN